MAPEHTGQGQRHDVRDEQDGEGRGVRRDPARRDDRRRPDSGAERADGDEYVEPREWPVRGNGELLDLLVEEFGPGALVYGSVHGEFDYRGDCDATPPPSIGSGANRRR